MRDQFEERDTNLNAAKAEIAELRDKTKEQEAEIGDLKNTVERQGTTLDEVLQRVKHLEQAKSDAQPGTAERAEGSEHPERHRSDAPDDGDNKGVNRALDREVGGKAREERKVEPTRRLPSDLAIGFVWANVGGALAEAGQLMPSTAHADTVTGWVLGASVAGLAWVRHRRKARNADRSDG